jgi:hypothetical protein
MSTPHMIPVTSSNIAAFGYAPADKRLHVAFKNGGHYVYEGVDTATAAEAQAADSPGRFFASHIKGKFPAKKL